MSEISEVFNQVFVVLNMISLILSRLSFVGIFFCLLATFLTEKKGKPDSGKSKFRNGIPVCILLCVIFSTTRLYDAIIYFNRKGYLETMFMLGDFLTFTNICKCL